MNHLIKRIKKYKETKSDDDFEVIVEELKGLIINHCYKIESNERNDLEQELLMCLYKAINSFNVEIFQLLVESEFSNLNNVLNNQYISCFIDKYGDELFRKALTNERDFKLFIFEFQLFCNENQFLKYVDSAFSKTRAYYKRKHKTGDYLQVISLNTYTTDGIELLDKISDLSIIKNDIIDYSKLSEKEVEFLKYFIEGNRKLTEKEVAIKRGVTQQAVHSMFKRIAKKLKNK